MDFDRGEGCELKATPPFVVVLLLVGRRSNYFTGSPAVSIKLEG